jgi:diguanylate cyclase (GGDEF)-like protein/PAS domain S-box-containing protein
MQLDDIQRTEIETRWLQRASWLTLVAGVSLSLAAWWHTSQTLERETQERLQLKSQQLSASLQQFVAQHLHVLDTFQAMFRIQPGLDRKQFHQQYQALNPSLRSPALLAVQYAPVVAGGDVITLEQAVRQDRSLMPEGYADFKVHPQPVPGQSVMPILYNEPMMRNQPAFGLDLLSRPELREVVERTRDMGVAQASAPFELAQGGLGLVVRAPVYAPQQPIETVAQRRQAFLGVVSGVFRTEDLFRTIGGGQDWSAWHWQVADVTHRRTPLYDSARAEGVSWSAQKGAHLSTSVFLDAAGRRWELTLSHPHVTSAWQPYPLSILLGGLAGTMGLAWALRTGARRHAQAFKMARRLSKDARSSEHRLRSVLDHTVDGILTLDEQGHIQSVNHAVCRMFQRQEQDLLGRHLSCLFPHAAVSELVPDLDSYVNQLHVGMDGVGRRAEGMRGQGQPFPVDLAISQMLLEGTTQYIVMMRDLSAQEAAERAISEAQRQLNEVDEMRRVIVNNAPYAIFVLNTSGVIQAVNPAGERLVGHPAQELVGRCTTQRFFDPDQLGERARLLSLRLNQPLNELDVLTLLAQESPGLPSEWNMLHADGSHLVAEILVTELRNEFGTLTGYLAMAHDVTLRREAEHQLQHMAQHDALTGLPNRNMVHEQLKLGLTQAERDQRPLALMLLDLDRFKKINDSLGHHIGDSVLIEVARRLKTGMRTSDMVARLGGDEFAVVLSQLASPSDGEYVARKVIDLFKEPLRIGPHELRVTPSIGLALYPEHGTDAITLMRHADLAMYQAKNDGRNRFETYRDALQQATPDTLVLENDLYKALERQELRLHYQPQFDCHTGLITGAEALLRWEHNGKLVPPSDFIPMAEETGLIVPMGEWVLREACARAQQWRQQLGWPLRMSVNLSAVQLDQPDVDQVVARALHDTGLPATALELEITESVVVRESLRAADVLNRLRALGVSIAIDDFGVGYSSFAYLRELPVNRFKLDRSFLVNVPMSTGDSRLVGALIAMGHRLDVGIVAEGVETQAQADFLQAHGCDEAQGYHLGRPIKEEAFGALLAEHARLHPANAVLEAVVATSTTVN